MLSGFHSQRGRPRGIRAHDVSIGGLVPGTTDDAYGLMEKLPVAQTLIFEYFVRRSTLEINCRRHCLSIFIK